MKNLFSLFSYKPKLLDDMAFQELDKYFGYPCERSKLYNNARETTKEYKDYVHYYYHKVVLPVKQEFFNPKRLAKSSPHLIEFYEKTFSALYRELSAFKLEEDVKLIGERRWESALRYYIKESNVPAKAKTLAFQKIENMPKDKIKSILKEVVTELFEEIENAYKEKLQVLQEKQVSVLQKVYNIHADTHTIAQEVTIEQTKATFVSEKDKLMQELFPVYDDFLKKDRTRVFYYESLKKKQELEDAEKELLFRDREVTVKEKELDLNQREKEFAFVIVQKDLEIEKKSIELVQRMNLQELDKKQLEVAYQLLQIEKQGVAQAKDLIAMEKSLLEVRNVQFEGKVRELTMNIREQKFNLQEFKSKLDYQKRRVQVGQILLTAKKELESINQETDVASKRLRSYNVDLRNAREDYDYYQSEKVRLQREVEYLQETKR